MVTPIVVIGLAVGGSDLRPGSGAIDARGDSSDSDRLADSRRGSRRARCHRELAGARLEDRSRRASRERNRTSTLTSLSTARMKPSRGANSTAMRCAAHRGQPGGAHQPSPRRTHRRVGHRQPGPCPRPRIGSTIGQLYGRRESGRDSHYLAGELRGGHRAGRRDCMGGAGRDHCSRRGSQERKPISTLTSSSMAPTRWSQGLPIPVQDGVIHTAANPVTIEGLAPGEHTVQLVIGDPGHVPIAGLARPQLTIIVSDQGASTPRELP